MTQRWGERTLEHGGRILLALMTGLIVFAYAWVYVPTTEPGRVRGGAPIDVSGTIATYANDAVVVSTLGGERRTVRIAPSTTIVEVDAPATVANLRPGRSVAIQTAHRLRDWSVVARGIVVWGGG
jgi:hypothetical protein